MKPAIEELQRKIAQGVFDIAPDGWVHGTACFQGITRYSDNTVFYEDASGKEIYPNFDSFSNTPFPFGELRAEMAKLNENGHAWYTAIFTLTNEGKFKFDFDYDHLPAFDIMPSPESWLDEFKQYPRPDLQAQIQDWIDGVENDANNGDRRLVARLKELSSKKWEVN